MWFWVGFGATFLNLALILVLMFYFRRVREEVAANLNATILHLDMHTKVLPTTLED